MPRRHRALVACFVPMMIGAGAVVAPAQAPNRPAALSATGLILGQVVDADTGRGVPGVVVTIGPTLPPAQPVGELLDARPAAMAPPGSSTKSILTSADGRFLFRDLPKGRFTLTATAPGYVAGAYGQGRPQGPGLALDLDVGQALGGVSIRVWKYGSISGAVFDELGDPAVGIAVRCLRRAIAGGQKRFTTSGLVDVYTDDRGLYRVPNLTPGEYICGNQVNASTLPMTVAAASEAASASGNPNSSEAYRNMQASGNILSIPNGIVVGDLVLTQGGVSTSRGLGSPPPDANGRRTAYSQIYYPAAPTTTQASIVTVTSGEDRSGIDLRLRLAPAPRVSGRVIGPNGPAPFLSITLVPASGNDIVSESEATAARTVSDSAGSFTFLGVPSGQYVLKIRLYPRPAPGAAAAGPPADPTLWVAIPVTIGDTDISDLTVTLRTGVRVTGRVEFTGTRAQPSAADLGRIFIRMQSAEGRTSAPIAVDGRVAADGTFRTSGYPAGRYIASVVANTLPAGWSLKSMTYNGKDVSVEPLELTDTDVTGVVMTFTDRTTELSGSVMGPNGPDPNAEVVVFPADSMAWKEIGVVTRRGRNERVTPAGTFVITGLPPGEYFVAGIGTAAAGDRQDPAFLTALMPGATRVILADGGKATVQLTVRAR